MLLKCCTQYVSNFGKLSSGHRTGKGQFSFQTQCRTLLKNVQTTEQLCWFHMLVRLCSKILQARLQQYMLWEFDVQGRSRTGRGTRGQISIIPWIIKNKQGNSRKTHNSASLITLKLLTVWITTNCGKFLKRWKYRPPYLSPEKPIWSPWPETYLVKKQQLELDMEQHTGSKLGKEYDKAVYWHPVHFTHMQSTVCKMIGYMNHKLNQDYWESCQQPLICQWCHFEESLEELESLLMMMKVESEKTGLKFNIQKIKVMASGHTTSWLIDGEKVERVIYFILWLQNHCRQWLQPWI